MYYLRTRPAVDAVQFTVDKTRLKEYRDSADKGAKSESSSAPSSTSELTAKMIECAVNSGSDCLMCSS